MIANDTILDADINTAAGISFSKLASLTSGQILVGNGTNVATAVAASGDVTLANTGAFSVNSVQANSVNLGTDTVGNYVTAVSTPATGGLTGGVAGAEGTSPSLSLKNASNLVDNTVLKWDATNDQLVDSSITDDGTTVTITGNFTVTGVTTTASVETTNTQVTDALIELANGTTGNPTIDAGLVIERGDDTNVFIGFDEGLDLFVAGTTAITGTGSDAAPTPIAFLALELQVNDDSASGGSAGNETVIGYLAAGGLFTGSAAGRYLQNVTIDCGEY